MGSTLFAGLRACFAPAAPFRIWNVAIPAIIGAVGSIAGGLIGKKGQKEANKDNLQIAREQMEFQERMSGTSYQRGVEDMKAAGLNPMLAYSQGGASAPSGQTATMQNDAAPLAQGVTSSAGQAMQVMQAYQQSQLTQANQEQTEATTRKIMSETMSHDLNSARSIADLDKAMTEADKGRQDTGVSQQTWKNLEAQFGGITANSAAAAEQYREMKTRGGFAADVEKRKADSSIAQYGINEAKSTSEFWNKTGDIPKFLQLIMQVLRRR